MNVYWPLSGRRPINCHSISSVEAFKMLNMSDRSSLTFPTYKGNFHAMIPITRMGHFLSNLTVAVYKMILFLP